MNYKIIIISVFISLISACTNTYKVSSDVETAKLTVRSPQGRPIRVFTYDEAEACTGRKLLKASSKSGAASKSYTIKATQKHVFSINMFGQNTGASGFTCRFALRMPIESNQHYVVTVVADKGKMRCNNRVVNALNKESLVEAQFVSSSLGAKFSNSSSWCDNLEFVDVESQDGRFKTTIYQNSVSPGYAPYGTIVNSHSDQKTER